MCWCTVGVQHAAACLPHSACAVGCPTQDWKETCLCILEELLEDKLVERTLAGMPGYPLVSQAIGLSTVYGALGLLE